MYEEETTEEVTEEAEPTAEDRIKELELKAARVEELEAKVQEKEEQLAKFSNKDFNFKKFRLAEEEKRKEMTKGFSKKERLLVEEIDKMRERQDAQDERYYSKAKETALEQLAGEDKELRGKLEDAVKESTAYLGKPKDSDEVTKRYERAYALLMGSQKKVNPLFKFSPVTGQTPREEGTRFTDSPTGKAILEQKFGKLIAKAKSKDPNFKI